MIETLLVLPLILFFLSLTIYFGFAMQRMQRATMLDRYEAWRSVARAPGPAVDPVAGADTQQLRDTFFRADVPTRLTVEPSDFFPRETPEAWERAARIFDGGAGRLAQRYFDDLPRGRSMRFYTQHDAAVPLWQRLFPGSIRHRHTVMDSDWRFVNHVLDGELWYDDQLDFYRRIEERGGDALPRLTPGYSVRETFYSDFDRRIDPIATQNPLAEAVQEFYLTYPNYVGPGIETEWDQSVGWH